ncbi:response regulator transcription factor [Streptomyces sp. T-3]|nr:response regulator transcription factor [Streptomyces sp. T-3]
MNILIVEDDDGVAEALEQMLAQHGYHTRRSDTGGEALAELPGAALVLLDLSLPDLVGHEVCRRIRERSCVPVIVLSGSDHELDRVMALQSGADDFVPKPFGRYELLARIQAVMRRSVGCPLHDETPSADDTPRAPLRLPRHEPEPAFAPPLEPAGRLGMGPLRLDPRARKVFLDDREVRVTRKEFDLLAMLLEEPGAVMQREEIMARVWDENWFGSTRTLDVHVGSLRAKLGSTEWIETVRGVGYRLTVPAVMTAYAAMERSA